MRSDAEERFVAWLVTQSNARGSLYLERVARQYANYLRAAPPKLDLPLPVAERNVYFCKTADELERLQSVFFTAPNYKAVNEMGHQTFSAGLAAYKRYLESLAEQKLDREANEPMVPAVVPTAEISDDIEITYAPKGNGGLTNIATKTSDDSAVFAQRYVRLAFREWLSDKFPSCSTSTINTLCSDALYLHNNNRGITLSEAMTADNGLEKACKAMEQFFAVNPRQTGTAATAAKGYTDTLRLFKEFITQKMPDLLNDSTKAKKTITQGLLTVLSECYSTGFRFETTAIRLLSDRSGIEVDEALQNALKRSMFRRKDDVYFLLDSVVDAEKRQDIITSANCWLDDYGCFELSELYALFANKVNSDYIGDVDDFEALYEFINKRDIRCVAYYGTRIARIQKSIPDLSADIAKTIIASTRDELGGVIDEDELRSRFAAFSAELLSKIIKQYAEELVKTEINGIICYQTLDTLGLPDDFSIMMSEVLSRIDELDLTPSQEVLNTALSLQLGVNFRNEYSIPDDQTFRRLITMYYKAAPRREWKGGVFAEVSD